MSPVPFTCNGCGLETQPSKEHLIHLAVGRVLFRNNQLTTKEMRDRLQRDWFSELRGYVDPLKEDPFEGGKPVRLGEWVKNLICADCNRTWARKLEEEAGSELDTWTDIGGTAALIGRLHRNPLVSARPVRPDEDALPPGLTRH